MSHISSPISGPRLHDWRGLVQTTNSRSLPSPRTTEDLWTPTAEHDKSGVWGPGVLVRRLRRKRCVIVVGSALKTLQVQLV